MTLSIGKCQFLCKKKIGRNFFTKCLPTGEPFLGIGTATDASVGSDGGQRVPQLGQDNPQQIQFVHRTLLSNEVGQRRHGGGQFARIHNDTPTVSVCDSSGGGALE